MWMSTGLGWQTSWVATERMGCFGARKELAVQQTNVATGECPLMRAASAEAHEYKLALHQPPRARPAVSAAAAALAAARAAPSSRHVRRCPPSRQSAWEQAVPQYHTARQELRGSSVERSTC